MSVVVCEVKGASEHVQQRSKSEQSEQTSDSAGVEKRLKEWTCLGETTTLDVSSIRPKGPSNYDPHPSCTKHLFSLPMIFLKPSHLAAFANQALLCSIAPAALPRHSQRPGSFGKSADIES
jgi:hypothetical protein